MVMINKMRRRTQTQPIDTQLSLPDLSLLPCANITTLLKLHASPYSPQSQKKSLSLGSQQRSIQMHETNQKEVTFHHKHKMTSMTFQFDRVFDQNIKSPRMAQQIDLPLRILRENRDVCIIAMGSDESGLQQLCSGQEGLIFSLLKGVWECLQAMKGGQTTPGINSVHLSVRMLAGEQQRLFDMLSPKTEVSLKDVGNRIAIGCTSFTVLSIYDLSIKLQQVFHQRRLIYPESVAIFEAEVTVNRESYLITEEEVNTRFFTVMQWPRIPPVPSNKFRTHSQKNQSLLTMNMCIYQLYKISCHPPERVTQEEVRQLWAQFRNSHIVMLTKYYFMGGNDVVLLACLPLIGGEESDSYQLMMLAKNLGKINLENFEEYTSGLKHNMIGEQSRDRKIKTDPLSHSKVSPFCSEEPSPSPKLRKLKENLQRILKQKQGEQTRRQEEELVKLFKQRKKCRRELEGIRYKKEEIRIREDIGRIAASGHNSRVLQREEEKVTLPILQNKRQGQNRPSEQELARLSKEEENALKRIQALQQQIMEQISSSENGKLGASAIQMQLRLQEKEMVDFVSNKNRILALLKQRLREMKRDGVQMRQPPPNFKLSSHKRRYAQSGSKQKKDIGIVMGMQEDTSQSLLQSPKSTNPQLQSKSKRYQQQQDPSNKLFHQVQTQQSFQSLTPDSPEGQKGFPLATLKKLNIKNYMFEKRRLVLKAKLSKGREDLNQFYQHAAKKFQEYKRQE